MEAQKPAIAKRSVKGAGVFGVAPTRREGPLDRLQSQLGHRFNARALLIQALTHRSFGADHNERLEFLGDSVLGLAVSDLLYGRLSTGGEGELSRMRAYLVRQDTLHQLAQRLGLSACIRLGEGERQTGGAERPSILADALEALIGAVYLDAGWEAARQVVHGLFADVRFTASTSAAAKDAKTSLQEWLQARRMALPLYEVTLVEGAAHQQTFHVTCHVAESDLTTQGKGASRRAAEQAAAAAMQQQLGS